MKYLINNFLHQLHIKLKIFLGIFDSINYKINSVYFYVFNIASRTLKILQFALVFHIVFLSPLNFPLYHLGAGLSEFILINTAILFVSS